MNDFSEIEHGRACMQPLAVGDLGEALAAIIDRHYLGLFLAARNEFLALFETLRLSTYITSISEHGNDEDELGRLSMWRAYGSNNGVAIVLNPQVFMTDTDAIGAFSWPVNYKSEADFREQYIGIIKGLEAADHTVWQGGPEATKWFLLEMLKSALLCTKHPAFEEEREWRIVHTPGKGLDHSKWVQEHTVEIGGVPQRIAALKLVDDPDIGLEGLDPAKLIDRILIGPTQYPQALFEAFVQQLHELGVPDPSARVYVTNIPLRQG